MELAEEAFGMILSDIISATNARLCGPGTICLPLEQIRVRNGGRFLHSGVSMVESERYQISSSDH